MNNAIVMLSALVLSALAVIPQAQAGGTPTVFAAPAFQPAVRAKQEVQFAVSVSNMPFFDGFDIFVRVDLTQLTPVSISISGSVLPVPEEIINCVNGGKGIFPGNPGNLNCTPWDGPGITHEAAVSSFFALGNGPLFIVTYKPVKHASSLGTVIDIYDDFIFNATPTPVPHITLSGFYGSRTLLDFSISASPLSTKIPQGRTGNVSISIASINGFAGTLNLNANTFPRGLPVSLSASTVILASNGTGTLVVTVSPTAATTLGSYSLVVNATGGRPDLIHSVVVSITVTQPYFIVATSIQFPASLIVPQGSFNSTTLILTSVNTFAGIVVLSAFVWPTCVNTSGLSFTLSNSTFAGKSVEVALSSGGNASATLTVFASASALPGGCSVQVIGTSGGIGWRTSVPLTVVSTAGKHHGHH